MLRESNKNGGGEGPRHHPNRTRGERAKAKAKALLLRQGERCRGIPRGFVEVGQDYGGLEQRNLKSEVGGFLATSTVNGKERGSHACRQTQAKTPGANTLERERESFYQTTDAQCNGEMLASERGQKRHPCLQTRKTTQRSKKMGREIFYYNHSARWRVLGVDKVACAEEITQQ